MTEKDVLIPNYFKYLCHIVDGEYQALATIVRQEWRWFLVLLIGLVLLFRLASPIPPFTVNLATGQADSTFDVIGKRYQQYFLEHGVELNLIPTKGAQHNMGLIANGQVDGGFSQGGLKTAYPAIVSLGSIGYQPLWLFYRGETFTDADPLKYFSKKKISLNIPGSGTHALAKTLLEQHKLSIGDQSNLLELSSQQSINELLAEKIDAMFLVAGMDSENVSRLTNTPGIRVFNFSLARAYERQIDYLEVVRLPRGSIDLNPIIPATDIDMAATTITMLVNKDLHPAIQYLFLKAAADHNKRQKAFFPRQPGFPAYTDKSVPESPVAQRYFDKGASILDGYLPFWVASLFDRAWFYVVALFAIIYPLMRIIPNYRMVYFDLWIDQAYQKLNEIKKGLDGLASDQEREIKLAALQELSDAIKSMWVPIKGKKVYFSLLGDIRETRERVEQTEQELPA